MSKEITLTIENLTDEQVLKEFVKRFECDGAVLVYMDNRKEFGFARWKTADGRIWANHLLKILKKSPIPSFEKAKSKRIQKILEA